MPTNPSIKARVSRFMSRRSCGESMPSPLDVLFLLFVLFLPNLAPRVALVQDVLCRFGTFVPRRIAGSAGKGTAHHAPHPSPHHDEAKSHHDYHCDGNYPPPSKPETKAVVSPHLNHLLSFARCVLHRAALFTNLDLSWARIRAHFSRRSRTRTFVRVVP
jgi:hypothetical protein